MTTKTAKRRRAKAVEIPDVAQSVPTPALAAEAATDGDVTQTNGTIDSGADPQANGTDTDGGANTQAIGVPVVGGADANVNGADPRTDGHDVQPAIDELVRRYGGNLRGWPEFPRVIAEAGLQPQDVTDMRLAMASLHLHQRAERFREDAKAANADPNNRLKIVIKGDPEFDLTFRSPASKENVMSKKKKNRKPKMLKAEATPKAKRTKEAPANAERGMSALDAAVRVLTESGQPMSCPELIAAMESKGYWKSPGGLTPAATLSAAIGSEIRKKGAASRFAKTAPGRYALAHP